MPNDVEKQLGSASDLGDSIRQDGPEITRIQTSGTNNEFVTLGNYTYHRDELMRAFAGTLNPGGAPTPSHKFGNPVPLGLSVFSLTALLIGLCLVQSRGVTNAGIVNGMAFFCGGVGLIIASIWCLVVENTFAATVFGAYGGFWLSYGATVTDSFGIASSYTTAHEFNQAMGLYCLVWTIFSVFCTTLTLKSTWGFFLMFVIVDLLFLLLAIGYFLDGHVQVMKAGGYFAIFLCVSGLFNAYEGMYTPESSYIPFKTFYMPGAVL